MQRVSQVISYTSSSSTTPPKTPRLKKINFLGKINLEHLQSISCRLNNDIFQNFEINIFDQKKTIFFDQKNNNFERKKQFVSINKSICPTKFCCSTDRFVSINICIYLL